MSLDVDKIRELIAHGEGDKIEFKESAASLDKIRQAVCAQANGLSDGQRPGYVLIGVKDDRTITGVSADDAAQQRVAQIRLDGNITPTPNMSLHVGKLDGGTLIILKILPSTSPPVRFGGVSYVRIGTTTGRATPDEERQLIASRLARALPFDARGIGGTSKDDVDLARFQLEFLPQAVAPEVIAENGRPIEQQLSSLNLSDPSGEITPTGLLAVGKNVSHWLPSAYVQFRRVAGIHITDPTLDQAEFRGTIADMVRAAEEKFKAHNLSSLAIGGPAHQISDQFPLLALEQIFRNAIMHRDYEMLSPVRVTWFEDRVQIDNPGGPFGIPVDKFGEPGFTSYRNPNIAAMMKTLGLVEQFGVGIPTARRRLADAGHPPLELQSEGNFTFCVIRARP